MTTATSPFHATRHSVLNRGQPPESFLSELVAWGRKADDEIFAPNNALDVYATTKIDLGPWESLAYRRAAMLEIMRVLAGFESEWSWTCGRDTTNHSSVTPDTIEAGAWQVSANSIHFGDDLRALVKAKVGSTTDGTAFQAIMKHDHEFAMEYIARLLRHTVAHNGPVLRREINSWLRRDAVKEFFLLLA